MRAEKKKKKERVPLTHRGDGQIERDAAQEAQPEREPLGRWRWRLFYRRRRRCGLMPPRWRRSVCEGGSVVLPLIWNGDEDEFAALRVIGHDDLEFAAVIRLHDERVSWVEP